MTADLRNGTVDQDEAMTLQGSGHGSSPGNMPHVVAGALRASDGHHGHSSPRGDGSDNLVYSVCKGSDPIWAEELAQPQTNRNGDPGTIASAAGVRRLTPTECCRLMGWPDDWLKWTADGREIPDSHQYRMAGNGVVSTVAEYIGHRLVAVDRLLP